MNLLTSYELQNVNGGFSKYLWGGIAIGVVFIASVVYGFIHPNRCN